MYIAFDDGYTVGSKLANAQRKARRDGKKKGPGKERWEMYRFKSARPGSVLDIMQHAYATPRPYTPPQTLLSLVHPREHEGNEARPVSLRSE